WLSTLLLAERFSVRRTLPSFGTAGEPLPYSVVVTSRSRRVLRGLSLAEETPDPSPSLEAFAAAGAFDAGSSLIDRISGSARWRGLEAERSIASVSDVSLPDLPPGGTCEARAVLVPSRRGRFTLSGVSIARPDPVGLVNAVSFDPVEQLVMILPRRYPVPRLELPGTRRYQQGGVSLSSSVGESQEFMSLRDYRPGDPLRRIHWRSWAKTGRPIVRECQDEFFVRHALVLDTFLDGRPPSAFEEAVSVAASFACAILTQESLLDLLFVGAESYCFTAGRGLAASQQMLEILASVEPCRSRPFSTLRSSVLLRRHALSGVICVLLAWDDERRELVSRLRGLKVPVVPLVVSMPGETLPDEGGFHRLEVGRIPEGLAKL
ncbi:MAG: DUF58 domain-containing protein, partial [Elusimicrobiota bacterium]